MRDWVMFTTTDAYVRGVWSTLHICPRKGSIPYILTIELCAWVTHDMMSEPCQLAHDFSITRPGVVPWIQQHLLRVGVFNNPAFCPFLDGEWRNQGLFLASNLPRFLPLFGRSLLVREIL